MNREQVMEKLTNIFIDLFEDEEIVLNDNTTAQDIDGWDSLTYLQMIGEVEKEFNIRFTLGEINGFANVGEMCTCILLHLSKQS